MNGKMKMRTNGMTDYIAFESLYNKQVKFQKNIVKVKPYDFEVGNLPEDNVKGFSFHIQQLMSEIGEVLSADKRWKNFRNEKYDLENKKEEIADCFIVLMNVAIFSGLTAKDLEAIICNKIDQNNKRIESV